MHLITSPAFVVDYPNPPFMGLGTCLCLESTTFWLWWGILLPEPNYKGKKVGMVTGHHVTLQVPGAKVSRLFVPWIQDLMQRWWLFSIQLCTISILMLFSLFAADWGHWVAKKSVCLRATPVSHAAGPETQWAQEPQQQHSDRVQELHTGSPMGTLHQH